LLLLWLQGFWWFWCIFCDSFSVPLWLFSNLGISYLLIFFLCIFPSEFVILLWKLLIVTPRYLVFTRISYFILILGNRLLKTNIKLSVLFQITLNNSIVYVDICTFFHDKISRYKRNKVNFRPRFILILQHETALLIFNYFLFGFLPIHSCHEQEYSFLKLPVSS